MNNLKQYITEKLHINKDIKLSDFFELQYKSSIISAKELKQAIIKRTGISKIDIINEKSEGYVFYYNIRVYDIKDLFSLLFYCFDMYSTSDYITSIDKILKKCIVNYNKSWKDFIHTNFSDKELEDGWWNYTTKN